MQTRLIPGTDLQPSVLCFGGGSLCQSDFQPEAFRLLDQYQDLGGNFIDTANVYGKWLPAASNISERYIGSWLASRKNRNRIVLATKGGHPDLATMGVSRLSRQDVLADLDESLKSLQTDYIDLYWLHRDDENRPVAEILGYLNDFVRSGKIRWFGCSNWKPARIREAIELSAAGRLQGLAANQLLWSLAEYRRDTLGDPTMVGMDEATWQLHRQVNLAAVPYSSQAHGYFQKLGQIGKDQIKPDLRRMYDLPVNDRRFAAIGQMAEELPCTLDELVLGYLLAQPFPVFPIIGARTADQLALSMKAGQRVWDAAVGERLRAIR